MGDRLNRRRNDDGIDVERQAAAVIAGGVIGACASRRPGFRVSRRVIKVMDAQVTRDSLTCGSLSLSLRWRRALVIHDRDRSTMQRRGRTAKLGVFGGRCMALILMSSRRPAVTIDHLTRLGPQRDCFSDFGSRH